MAILNFTGRVTIAERLVKEKYPNVTLYEVQGKSSRGQSVSANDVDKLTAVFNVNVAETETPPHVIIESTGWGEFGEPQFFSDPWDEDCMFSWPIRMDLEEAVSLKKAAGYKEPFSAMVLRQPLHPRVKNPFYIFSQITGEYVFVDVVTKRVSTGF